MTARDSADAAALPYLRRRRLARASALRFLYQADLNGSWEADESALKFLWEQLGKLEDASDPRDLAACRGFAEKLIAGVVAHRGELDARIGAAAENWSLERMGIVDRNILRLAAYEILLGEGDAPPLAALNEAIELAKEFSDKDSPRFVNGILDQLVKKK